MSINKTKNVISKRLISSLIAIAITLTSFAGAALFNISAAEGDFEPIAKWTDLEVTIDTASESKDVQMNWSAPSWTYNGKSTISLLKFTTGDKGNINPDLLDFHFNVKITGDDITSGGQINFRSGGAADEKWTGWNNTHLWEGGTTWGDTEKEYTISMAALLGNTNASVSPYDDVIHSKEGNALNWDLLSQIRMFFGTLGAESTSVTLKLTDVQIRYRGTVPPRGTSSGPEGTYEALAEWADVEKDFGADREFSDIQMNWTAPKSTYNGLSTLNLTKFTTDGSAIDPADLYFHMNVDLKVNGGTGSLLDANGAVNFRNGSGATERWTGWVVNSGWDLRTTTQKEILVPMEYLMTGLNQDSDSPYDDQIANRNAEGTPMPLDWSKFQELRIYIGQWPITWGTDDNGNKTEVLDPDPSGLGLTSVELKMEEIEIRYYGEIPAEVIVPVRENLVASIDAINGEYAPDANGFLYADWANISEQSVNLKAHENKDLRIRLNVNIDVTNPNEIDESAIIKAFDRGRLGLRSATGGDYEFTWQNAAGGFPSLRPGNNQIDILIDETAFAKNTVNWEAITQFTYIILGVGYDFKAQIASGDIGFKMTISNARIVYLTEGDGDVQLGDVNEDDDINIFDIMIIRDKLFGKTELSGNAAIAADVNEDGDINIFDIMAIRDHIFGKTNLYA